MNHPVPERRFEVHGEKLYQLELGSGNMTTMLFWLRDPHKWVAWYKFTEVLTFDQQNKYDLLSIDTPADRFPAYDKTLDVAEGAGWTTLVSPKPIRVDQFGTSGTKSHLVNAVSDTLGPGSLEITLRIFPYKSRAHTAYNLELDFISMAPPDSELRTLFGFIYLLKLERDGKTMNTKRFERVLRGG